MDRTDRDEDRAETACDCGWRMKCLHCGSPYVGSVLVKGKALCGSCALIIWLTGSNPVSA